MDFETAVRLYQFPINQKLAIVIRHRIPYIRDELPTVNTSEAKVLQFILNHKDAISDYEKIAAMYKNKSTKDVEKHWHIKILGDNAYCKNSIINDLNEIIEKQAIPRILLSALEYYYPERLNIVRKRIDRNINNNKGKVKLTAIAVNEPITDEIIKVIQEVKAMELIPELYEKAVISSKRPRPVVKHRKKKDL